MLTFNLVVSTVVEPDLTCFYWKVIAISGKDIWVTYINKDELRYFDIGDEFTLFRWEWMRRLFWKIFAFDTFPHHFWWEKEKTK